MELGGSLVDIYLMGPLLLSQVLPILFLSTNHISLHLIRHINVKPALCTMALMHKNADNIVLMDEIVFKLAVLATEKGRDHGEAHRRIWGLMSCWNSSIYLALLRSMSWPISFWL